MILVSASTLNDPFYNIFCIPKASGFVYLLMNYAVVWYIGYKTRRDISESELSTKL